MACASPHSGSLNLEQAFARIQQELAPQGDAGFRVIVDGQPGRCIPSCAMKSIASAGRRWSTHSVIPEAKSIEIELEYAFSHLRVLVRDNGCGIDPQLLQSGRDGHWGLTGMRERADRIGAKLHVWSSPAAGTEVELSVPSHVAYRSRSSRVPRWFARLYSSAKTRHPIHREIGERHREMTDQARIRVLTVDDHPLLREGIAAIINSQPDMSLVAEAASSSEAVQQYREHRPDVTLMDLRLPDASGIDAMIAIRAEFADARIIMLTTFEGDVEIQRALEAGARGYMLKSMPPRELVEVIRQVHAGKKRVPSEVASSLAEHLSDESLTTREIDVLRHVAGGNRNRDIAEQLYISEETVKVHVKHIMEKLGASDRTQAVAIAVRRGIIQL